MKILKKAICITSAYIFKLIWHFHCRFNNKSKSCLVFTDSRGFYINGILNYKNPFRSYINNELKYKFKYNFCPQKSTTLIDFLYSTRNFNKNVPVILHCGIVDFSPRNKKHTYKILKRLNNLAEKLNLPVLESNPLGGSYCNELTYNLYTIDYLKNHIIHRLLEYKNLIYIGINPVILDWRGNYFRDRPDNINIILKYNEVLVSMLSSIDISKWDEKQIKDLTVDNIHLSANGMNYLKREVKNKLNSL